MQQVADLVSRTHSRSRLITKHGHWLVPPEFPAGEAQVKFVLVPITNLVSRFRLTASPSSVEFGAGDQDWRADFSGQQGRNV